MRRKYNNEPIIKKKYRWIPYLCEVYTFDVISEYENGFTFVKDHWQDGKVAISMIHNGGVKDSLEELFNYVREKIDYEIEIHRESINNLNDELDRATKEMLKLLSQEKNKES